MFAAHSISQLSCPSLPRQLVRRLSTLGGNSRAADEIANDVSVALLAAALRSQSIHAIAIFAGRLPAEDAIEVGDEGSAPKRRLADCSRCIAG